MHRPWLPKTLAPLFATAVAIALVLCVFRPLESAMLNWGELSLGFGALLAQLALPMLWATATGMAIGLALTLCLGQRGIALLSALLLCAWIQGSFLVWNYGVFDGSPIDWSLHSGRGLIEAILWSSMFGLAIVRPRWLTSRATAMAVVVSLVQGVSLAVTYRAHAPFAEHVLAASQPGDPSEEAQRRSVALFSSEQNVLVLVLDTLQSDFFAELLQDPEFAQSVPPGFSFYRNAVSPYPHTQHSLPAMLHSRTPAQHPKPEWTVMQMKRSLPALLQQRGWQSTVLTTTPPYLACNQVRFEFACQSQRSFAAASDASAGHDLDVIEDARSLLRLAAFRTVPHYLKAWLYDAGRWRVPDPYPAAAPAESLDPNIWPESQRDLIVWRTLIRDSRSGGDRPSFKFLHFFAAHHPSSIDANCGWNGLDNPEPARRDETATRHRRVALEASHCSLTRAFEFLRRLDELGVYDRSLVFVVGDHGRPHTPVDLTLASPPLPVPPRDTTSSRQAPAHPSKGVPLVLVKRIGDRSELRISDAPISLCDLPKTISDELGLEYDFQCESIFELGSKRQSPRLHFRGMDEYGVRFPLYRVEGHAWRPQSWKRVHTDARAPTQTR